MRKVFDGVTIALAALLVLGGVASPAQTKGGCSLITPDEAASVLGGKGEQNEVGPMCVFVDKVHHLALTVSNTTYGPKTQLVFDESRKGALGQKAVVKDETGFGVGAYSAVYSGMSGTESAITALKGKVMLSVSVKDDGGNTHVAGSAATLDKLRPVAKKALDRL
jgi:hypothetical protein